MNVLIEDLLAALQQRGCNPRRSGTGWTARCPAHEDRRPSLCIARGDGGRVLLKCHAGCSVAAVCQALGIGVADLFDGGSNGLTAANGSACHVASNASQPAHVAAPEASVRTWERLGDIVGDLSKRFGCEPSADWSYFDANGRLIGGVLRFDVGGHKEIRPVRRTADDRWQLGALPEPRPLYRLPELLKADLATTVLILEGERCVDAARRLGFAAATSFGGASAASKTDWSPMRGRRVVLLPDFDRAGLRYADDTGRLCQQAGAAEVRILRLWEHVSGLPEGGDLADLVADPAKHGLPTDRADLAAWLRGLVEAAEPWKPTVSVNPTSTATVRLADVRVEAVDWLWPNRVPLGCVTLICGRPGVGKSFLTCDLAARVSAGLLLPDGMQAPLGDTLLLAAEDDPARTLRPRCEAAGADLRRIHAVATPNWTLADLGNLERALDSLPEARLIVLDPITHYLPGRTDLHRDNEVREALGGLATLAKERNLAVLLIAHNRKAASEFADDLVLGSRALSALPRAVHHALYDPDADGRRLLLPGKCNLVAPPPGLAYRIGGHPPRLEWEAEPVQLRADDVIRRHRASERPGPEPQARNNAADWLRELLRFGPVPTEQVRAEARKAELSWRTVRRAFEAIGGKVRKQAFTGGWAWELPVE